MKILYDTVNIENPEFDYKKTSSWIEDVISDNQKKIKELSIIFCNDEYILETNRKYLNHDYYTDIITFDYSEKNYISGDLLISLETVKHNADNYSVTFINELQRVIIHGILHLLGYNDKTEEQKALMTQKEDYYLNYLV